MDGRFVVWRTRVSLGRGGYLRVDSWREGHMTALLLMNAVSRSAVAKAKRMAVSS